MDSYSSIVRSLPFLVPFVAPEALERELGRPFRLRLGANESPFGISPKAIEAMERELPRSAWYGDPDSYDLRFALANRHGVSMENVLVGPGLDDLLLLSCRTFLDPGDVAVTSLGGYPTFAYGVEGVGGQVVRVPYSHDKNDLFGLAEAAREHGAKLVYLANPDNPSGSWHHGEAILAMVHELPADAVLLLDEAYYEYAPSESVPAIDVTHPQIVRLRTFSKIHGMAGQRIGYAFATAETVASFNKIRLHFGINRVAQAGALASLDDLEFQRQVIAEVERGREDYSRSADELGFTALPSATNFVTIDVGGFENAKRIVQELAKDGVFIRMPGAEPLNRCIRVTIGTPTQRAEFAEALRKVR